MTCEEYRDRVTVRMADGSELAGGHGESCAECGRYLERARVVWEAAGRLPDEAVPAAVSKKLMRSCRRPRRSDLFLLRPASVAAAALLVVTALVLFLPGRAGPGPGSLMDPDGMTVERYDLPAGAWPSAVSEELRRNVSPEAWTEGIGGLEEGEGFLRVRGPADLQRGVREYLRRYGQK